MELSPLVKCAALAGDLRGRHSIVIRLASQGSKDAPTSREFRPSALGAVCLGTSRHKTASLCRDYFLRNGESLMPHWRKSYQPTSQFNSIALWATGASMLVGALVFIARHVYL